MRGAALAIVVSLLLGCVHGQIRTFSIEPLGALEVELPRDWTVQTIREAWPPEAERADERITWRIEPPRGIELVLQISPLPADDGGRENPARIARRLDHIRASLAETSVEAELPTREIAGPGCHASFISATDRTVDQPGPDEFKYVDLGVADVGALILTFTSLSNQLPGPERAQALEIVRRARFVPSPGGLAWAATIAPNHPAILELPGHEWQVELDLPSYKLEKLEFRNPSVARLFGSDSASGVLVSAIMEPAELGESAMDHREWAYRENPFYRSEASPRRWQVGDRAFIEFTIAHPEMPGEEWQQTNRFVHLVHDGVWIRIHLSKIGFRPADEKLFDAVSDSLRIRDPSAPDRPEPVWDAALAIRRSQLRP
jgi:hypothetical protein